MKKLAGVIVGTAVVFTSAAAFAEPESARGTMVQALESVEKNSAKNLGNRGLTNATTRLLNNARRHDAHQTEKAGATDKETRAGAERAQIAERVERVERPERPERPDSGRPDHPGRPNR
jgi:hypothetical protein